MADPQIGDIDVNPNDPKDRAKLVEKDGGLAWERIPFEPTSVVLKATENAPSAIPGWGNALFSGVVNQGVPAIAGLPGTVSDLMNKGGAALASKVTGKDVTPEQLAKVRFQGMFMGANQLPTTEQVAEKVGKTFPEYEPKTFGEKVLKTTGALLPGAAVAPELLAVRGLPQAASAITRYAAAPALTSEAVREVPGIKGSPYENWAAMAALLGTPAAAGRAISLTRPTAAQQADKAILTERGVTPTPGQVTQSSSPWESKALDFSLSPGSTAKTNQQQIGDFVRGALNQFEGIPGIRPETLASRAATPAVRAEIRTAVGNEFNRLTHGIGPTIDPTMSTAMTTLARDYANSAKGTTHDPGVLTNMRELLQEFRTKGTLSASDYQNWRSTFTNLSHQASEGTNPPAQRFYSGMRDLLDRSMENVIATTRPQDLGAFRRARDAYTNILAIDSAMGGQATSTANHMFTPQQLGASLERTIGPRYVNEATPMAQYAKAGERGLNPLPPGSGTGMSHNYHLLPMLAGLSAGSGAGGLLSPNEHGWAAGGVAGGILGALPYLLGRVPSAMLLNSNAGRRALSNGIIPAEGTSVPANAALMAGALASKPRRPWAEE